VNLFRAVATVSGWTLASRILGFLRDMVIARMFGAGAATDAFFVAFRIPNLLRRLFAEGAFSQAFVPILAEYKNRRGDADTHVLVDRVASVLVLGLAVVSVAGVIAAPIIVYLTAPGFAADAAKFELTVLLLRITFPYIFFISLAAFAAGILNTWGRFAIPAFTPVLLNLSFLAGALVAAPYFDPPVVVLAWAVFVGGILQLGLQLPVLARIGMLPWRRRPGADAPPPSPFAFGTAVRDDGVRRVLKTMVPALLGVSVSQVSLVINTIIASHLAEGSVSWLYYADRLMEFPTALLGAALGTVLLPTLARHHADADAEAYSRLLDWGMRLTLVLSAPAAAALAILSAPLVTTLFQYGAFSPTDARQTADALVAYSVGLLGLILVRVLSPGFYARQNMITPVRIALLTLFMTQVLNVVLVFGLSLGHVGLALAISVGACLNAGLLFSKLRSQGAYRPRSGWASFAFKVLVALAAMSLTLWFACPAAAWWGSAATVARAGGLGGLVVLGAVVYLGALFAMGFRPRDFTRQGANEPT